MQNICPLLSKSKWIFFHLILYGKKNGIFFFSNYLLKNTLIVSSVEQLWINVLSVFVHRFSRGHKFSTHLGIYQRMSLLDHMVRVGFSGGCSCKACQCRRLQRWGFSSLVRKILWRRAWQSTPVFISREFHGHHPASISGWKPKPCSKPLEAQVTWGQYQIGLCIP